MMRRKWLTIGLIGVMLLGGIEAPVWTLHRAAAEGTAGSARPAASDSDVLDALFGGASSGSGESKEKDAREKGADKQGQADAQTVVEDDYFDVLDRWRKEGAVEAAGVRVELPAREFRVEGRPAPLLAASQSEGYGKEVLRWDEKTLEVEIPVDVPQSGLYNLELDYYPLSGQILSIQRGIKINGDYPYFQARQFELDKLWKDDNDPFEKDSLGNDILPGQKMIPGWMKQTIADPASADDRPLLFYLEKGENLISLPFIGEPALLGAAALTSPASAPSYEDYARQGKLKQAPPALVAVEGERASSKNQPFIRVQADGSPSSIPFDSRRQLLNAIGGDSWQRSGQSVSWTFDVPADGEYRIAIKYKQNTNTSETGTDMPVYRTLEIDGELPFEEMRRVVFPFTKSWKNKTLESADGEPYLFQLQQGRHSLKLTANDAPYRETIRTIKSVMSGINDLAIEVKMATGNTQDSNRDWDLTEQIPGVADRLLAYADELDSRYATLAAQISRSPDAAQSLVISAQRLRNLAEDPNSLPYKYAQLSEGSGSIMQMLGTSLGKLPNQPLTVDRIYVYSDSKLPSAQAGLFSRLSANVSAFLASFTKDYSKVGGGDPDELQVWVNRPRQYVTMLQHEADEEFTRKTGIKVSFSLMPDETKLILANAAGSSPDMALSINNVTPFNLAVRGTLSDLSQFPDYEEVAKRFSPGAMLPFRFDGGAYALPETQNFWVMYYRKDILNALDIPLPETMDDVRRILPDLQRYGLNFFHPLSQTGGLKPLTLTAPFIYQSGGELFKDDGAGAAIDSENAVAGIKQMTDLFTVYNLPLNVPSFYNHFRDGSLPIGISDFATYVQLTSAAPEISGLWGIAPAPGVQDADGKIGRWQTGTGQSAVIFKDSKRQADAWELLKWWTSKETQVSFGNRMQTIYGPTYKWNTANLEAFDQMPWPKEDIGVIQEQWKWLKDVPHLPGDYMLERMLSDAWNKIVFNGVNPRRAIEDATILTNREMVKKLEEFKYMKNGKLVKPLEVPRLLDEKGR
ncbi:extracellular solute-binding protein [Paenibacillus sp. B01]|uniref:extracellular solute-binding protein n=1 Tax=Paenibacillus sp. B01 TaxID=2660554 RepID=UPI00129BD8F9|nr:extracellular solute-binding protein [Paenibacillus sp. B01]QGG57048.1 extracellular solute-binding protein [Paenibacillus sp. B01]